MLDRWDAFLGAAGLGFGVASGFKGIGNGRDDESSGDDPLGKPWGKESYEWRFRRLCGKSNEPKGLSLV